MTSLIQAGCLYYLDITGDNKIVRGFPYPSPLPSPSPAFLLSLSPRASGSLLVCCPRPERNIPIASVGCLWLPLDNIDPVSSSWRLTIVHPPLA